MRSSNLNIIIPCVDYSDMLRYTLPQLLQTFSEITVVTSPEDAATQSLCEDMKVRCFTTSAWYAHASLFNKAQALNEAIEKAINISPNSWVLILDADIFVPNGFDLDTKTLDPEKLYSVKRRICESETEWEKFQDGVIECKDFSLYEIPITNGKAWGHRPTNNAAGLSGYFQLWNPKESGLLRLPSKPTASCYDVEFALLFPEIKREWLDEREVIHLGPIKTNWTGRISSWWGTSGATNELPARGRFIAKQLAGPPEDQPQWVRLRDTKNSVFVHESANPRHYLKMFEEHERFRVQREEAGLEHFSRIATVPKILASSTNIIYSGVPFLVTESLPPEYTSIAGVIYKPNTLDALSAHFDDRKPLIAFNPLANMLEAGSYEDIVKRKIDIADGLDQTFKGYGGEIANASDRLMNQLMDVIDCLPFSRMATIQHGDFNPLNVFCDMQSNLALIDFEHVCKDDESADLFNLCNWLLDSSEDHYEVVSLLLTKTSLRLKPGFQEAWKVWSIFRWFTTSSLSLTKALPFQRRKTIELIIDRAVRLLARLTNRKPLCE